MTNFLNSLKFLNCDTLDIEADKTFWRQDQGWLNAVKETAYKNYKELAKQYHPDKLGGDTQKMTELNLAFETIKEEFKKGEQNLDLKYLTISERLENFKIKQQKIKKDFEYLKSLNINSHREVLNIFSLDLKYVACFDTIYEASIRTGLPKKSIERAIKQCRNNLGYYFLWSNYKKPKEPKAPKVKKLSREYGKCIVCNDISLGTCGNRKKFCNKHLNAYYRKDIDINGNRLKACRPRLPKVTHCKLCEKPHHARGFCRSHYLNVLYGKIDENGNMIAPVAPPKEPRLIEFDGKKLSIKEWAQLLNISTTHLYKRLKHWPLEKALSTPCNLNFRKKCVST